MILSNNSNLILLSAGKGKRFSGKKQFAELNGEPLFLASLKTFYRFSQFKKIILVIDTQDIDLYKKGIVKYLNNSHLKSDRILFVSGGEERYLSVWNGLHKIDKQFPYTFIHDVARPFIHSNDIENIFAILSKDNDKELGFVLGEKLVNTVKYKDEKGYLKSLSRESLVSVSTPQIFPSQSLYSAYQDYLNKNNANNQKLNLPTDDAEVYSLSRLPLKCIYSQHDNKKITFQRDLY